MHYFFNQGQNSYIASLTVNFGPIRLWDNNVINSFQELLNPNIILRVLLLLFPYTKKESIFRDGIHKLNQTKVNIVLLLNILSRKDIQAPVFFKTWPICHIWPTPNSIIHVRLVSFFHH